MRSTQSVQMKIIRSSKRLPWKINNSVNMILSAKLTDILEHDDKEIVVSKINTQGS